MKMYDTFFCRYNVKQQLPTIYTKSTASQLVFMKNNALLKKIQGKHTSERLWKHPLWRKVDTSSSHQAILRHLTTFNWHNVTTPMGGWVLCLFYRYQPGSSLTYTSGSPFISVELLLIFLSVNEKSQAQQGWDREVKWILPTCGARTRTQKALAPITLLSPLDLLSPFVMVRLGKDSIFNWSSFFTIIPRSSKTVRHLTPIRVRLWAWGNTSIWQSQLKWYGLKEITYPYISWALPILSCNPQYLNN